MKLSRVKEIMAVWNEIENKDLDISTERLMELTAQRCHCDHSDVAEALWLDEETVKGNVCPIK